ncbi:hypothetical protein N7481_008554 [Penicillium waksmanii]|uniref:uncharacterized protein n=1 Tax=Penicillium waksmanii TaxID=69791 RepID=UPI002547FEAA|nr:uncharacterized protein N7481_008554 [Penicillium waksmanii]KAJ5974847.1 hypothetical protein N7481_008554 [Penicillium waksmanii]
MGNLKNITWLNGIDSLGPDDVNIIPFDAITTEVKDDSFCGLPLISPPPVLSLGEFNQIFPKSVNLTLDASSIQPYSPLQLNQNISQNEIFSLSCIAPSALRQAENLKTTQECVSSDMKAQPNGPNANRENSIASIEPTKPKPELVNGSLASNTKSTMQPSKPLMPLAHHELLLKRNRQAAKRCRQKRKLQNQQDESTLKKQAARNKELLAGTNRLQYELLDLRLEILKHSQCEGYIKRYVEQMTGRVLSEDTASDVQQATTVVSANNKEKRLVSLPAAMSHYPDKSEKAD